MAKNVEEMLHEHSDLNKKIRKIESKIAEKSLSTHEKDLLTAQLHSMQSYSFILGVRIEEAESALKVEVKNER